MTLAMFQDTWLPFGGAEAVAETAFRALDCSSLTIGLFEEGHRPIPYDCFPIRTLAVVDPLVDHRVKLAQGIRAAMAWRGSPPALLAFHHHFALLVPRKPSDWTGYFLHTPTRFLWEAHRVPWEQGAIGQHQLDELRAIELDNIHRAQVLIANSGRTAKAVENAYGRIPHVVYPPLPAPRITMGPSLLPHLPDEFYLTVTRLVPGKLLNPLVGTDLPLPWVIVGDGRERRRLQDAATTGVRFLGSLGDLK